MCDPHTRAGRSANFLDLSNIGYCKRALDPERSIERAANRPDCLASLRLAITLVILHPIYREVVVLGAQLKRLRQETENVVVFVLESLSGNISDDYIAFATSGGLRPGAG